MKLKKRRKILIAIVLFIVVTYILVPYFGIGIDDYVVRKYLADADNVRGGVGLVGSSPTLHYLLPAREYIFTVGMEGTLEIVVSCGRVVSSRNLHKIPHFWSGSDRRLDSNKKWK